MDADDEVNSTEVSSDASNVGADEFNNTEADGNLGADQVNNTEVVATFFDNLFRFNNVSELQQPRLMDPSYFCTCTGETTGTRREMLSMWMHNCYE